MSGCQLHLKPQGSLDFVFFHARPPGDRNGRQQSRYSKSALDVFDLSTQLKMTRPVYGSCRLRMLTRCKRPCRSCNTLVGRASLSSTPCSADDLPESLVQCQTMLIDMQANRLGIGLDFEKACDPPSSRVEWVSCACCGEEHHGSRSGAPLVAVGIVLLPCSGVA